MKLTEYDSLQACLDDLNSHRDSIPLYNIKTTEGIDKKHGYRVKYIVFDDTDPRIDEFWPGTGLSVISGLSNKFKDVKSAVRTVLTLPFEATGSEIKFTKENELDNIGVERIKIFNGLIQFIAQYDRWKQYKEVGFIVISDMMYEHRKNSLSILMDI